MTKRRASKDSRQRILPTVIKQASVADLINGRVSRDQGYIVITMRFYPRFVHRELRDEYVCAMSPDRPTMAKFLAAKRKTHDHNAAFNRAGFEKKLELDTTGWIHLRRLSELSRKRDIYFICQCQVGMRCHRELLLMAARELFGARIASLTQEYPEFARRLKAGDVDQNARVIAVDPAGKPKAKPSARKAARGSRPKSPLP